MRIISSIRNKFLAGVVLLLLAFVVPAAYSVWSSVGIRKDVVQLGDRILTHMNQISVMIDDLEQIRRHLQVAVTELAPDRLDQAAELAKSFIANLESLPPALDPREDHDRLQNMGRQYMTEGLAMVRNGLDGGSFAGISERMSRLEANAEILRKALAEERSVMGDLLWQNLNRVSDRSLSSIIITVVMFVAIFGLGIAGAMILSGRITAGVRQVLEGMDNISTGAGDLTRRITVESHDEMRSLAESFNAFAEDLRQIMQRVLFASQSLLLASTQIRDETERLEEGSSRQKLKAETTLSSMERMAASMNRVAASMDELSAASEQVSRAVREMDRFLAKINTNAGTLFDLSRRTTELTSAISIVGRVVTEKLSAQQDRLRNVSASVDEIAGAVDSIVNTVEEADTIARQNAEMGERGGQAVDRAHAANTRMFGVIRSTTGAVQQLARRTVEIDDIVRLIDEIADQTNILALNAAVIAAQAGEHGRGFAVVAQNVRNLAVRSLEATTDISGIIEQIQGDAGEAVRMAEETLRDAEESEKLSSTAREAIRRMEEGSGRMAALLSRITASAHDQKALAERVTRVVRDYSDQASSIHDIMNEQKEATEEIEKVTTRVLEVATELKNGVKTSSTSSEEISRTMENIVRMTEEVASAVREQTRESDAVAQNMAEVKQNADTMLTSIQGISGSLNELTAQGRELNNTVGRFRV